MLGGTRKRTTSMKYITTVHDKEYTIEIGRDDEIIVNGESYQINLEQASDSGILSLLINNRSIVAVAEEQEEGWQVLINGELYGVTVQDERAYRLAKARGKLAEVSGEVTIKSPMPGIVLKVPVEAGEAVKKGQTVIILESMKMENELKAPRDGVLNKALVVAGTSVEKGQPLVVITDAE